MMSTGQIASRTTFSDGHAWADMDLFSYFGYQ